MNMTKILNQRKKVIVNVSLIFIFLTAPKSGVNAQAVISEPQRVAVKVAAEPLSVVDEQAAFNGNLNQWLSENIRYPDEALKDSITGRVIIKFVVTTKGKVEEPKIVKSAGKLLDEETIRVISMMPDWEPAKLDGRPVKSYFTLPVTYRF